MTISSEQRTACVTRGTPLGRGAAALAALAGLCTAVCASVCYIEFSRPCNASYQQPNDGCPDSVLPTDQTTWVHAPDSGGATGTVGFQATGPCTYYLQRFVPNPNEGEPACVPFGDLLQMISSGRMGAGDICVVSD